MRGDISLQNSFHTVSEPSTGSDLFNKRTENISSANFCDTGSAIFTYKKPTSPLAFGMPLMRSVVPINHHTQACRFSGIHACQ